MHNPRLKVWYARAHCPQCRLDIQAPGEAGRKPIEVECPQCRECVPTVNATIYPLRGFVAGKPIYMVSQ